VYLIQFRFTIHAFVIGRDQKKKKNKKIADRLHTAKRQHQLRILPPKMGYLDSHETTSAYPVFRCVPDKKIPGKIKVSKPPFF